MAQIPENHIQLIGAVTLGERGQIIVPVEVRKKMQLTAGDKLIALYIPDNDSVGFIKESKLQAVIDKMGAKHQKL